MFIKEILQKSATEFSILWNDGQLKLYRLSDLQKRCPCRLCTDEASGVYLKNPLEIPENLGAIKIESVGNYALRIFFKTGCQKGIFPFSFLRKWGKTL